MKNFILLVCCIIWFSNLYAQSGTGPVASLDLKQKQGCVEQVLPVNGEGVLLDIFYKKDDSHDFVYYDNNMQKKWTYSLSKQSLHVGGDDWFDNQQIQNKDKLIFVDNEFVYFRFQVQRWSYEWYIAYAFGLDGKLITMKKVHLGSANYAGIVTSNNKIYLNSAIDNIVTYYYYVQSIDTKTLEIGERVNLELPNINLHRWSFAREVDNQLIFYSAQKQSPRHADDGILTDVCCVNFSGSVTKKFTINVKLKGYWPGSETQPSNDAFSTNVYFNTTLFIDTLNKAIYAYGPLTDTSLIGKPCKALGIYVCKYSLDGKPQWTKQITNDEIAATGGNAAVTNSVSDYSQYMSEDPATGDLIIVRATASTSANKLPATAKCFLLNKEGSLINAYSGTDQSSVNWYDEQPYHPFSLVYTGITYKEGAPVYFKSLSAILSGYTGSQPRPVVFLTTVNNQNWAISSDIYTWQVNIFKL